MDRIYSYSCVSVSGSSRGSSSGSSGFDAGGSSAVTVWGFLSSSLQTVIFGVSAAVAYSLLQQHQQQQQHQSRSVPKDNQQLYTNTTSSSSSSSASDKTILSRWFLFLFLPFSRRVLQPVVHAVLQAARRGYHVLLLTLPRLSLQQQEQQQEQQQQQQQLPSDTDPPPLWFWLGMSWWVRLMLLPSGTPHNHQDNDNSSSSSSSSGSSNYVLQRFGLVPAVQCTITAVTLLFSGYYYYSYYLFSDDSDNNNNNNNNSSIFRNNNDNDDNNNKPRQSRYAVDHPQHNIMDMDQQHGDETTQRTTIHTTASNSGIHSTTGNRHGYLELLVHNVSHTDLILSLDTAAGAATATTASVAAAATEDSFCFARPRFSCFDMYSRRVLAALKAQAAETTDNNHQIPTMDFYRYQRSYENDTGTEVQRSRNSNNGMDNSDTDATIPRYCQKDTGAIPAGLVLPDKKDSNNSNNNMSAAVVGLEELNDLRIRGRDQAKLAQRLYREHNYDDDTDTTTQPQAQQSQQESIAIRHVFFPLLASLLPRWKEQIADKRYNAKSPVKRVLILVSGVGTPRNWTHAMAGNSTQACADLMEYFLQQIDPELTVVKIHSDTNIFRYDENLLFCERQLLPTVHAYRDAHAYQWPYPDEQTTGLENYNVSPNMVMPLPQSTQASSFNVDWHKSFALTLSMADGSPARTYAIQASLRPYRPTYFHFWQLKTFWHESKIVDDDLEVHSFEEMETSPAVDATRCTDPMIQAVVQEIKAFSAEMTLTLQQGDHDISKFWLRKTHKPVLAVLLVQSAGAKEPTLYRGTNMEVSMPTGSLCAERNVIGTALAANPALKREDLKLIAVLAVPQVEEITTSMKRVDSNISMAESVSDHSTRKPGSESENHFIRKTSIGSDQEVDWVLPPELGTDSSFTILETALDKQQCVECGERADINRQEATESTPVRRIKLFSKSTNARKLKRTVIVQSTKDLNPLRPCGACNEWLKKIAEPNPYFRILTFTDADCNGIYITPCQE